jgi:predicted O-methyltransferase YrrM
MSILTKLRWRLRTWPIRGYRNIEGWLTRAEALGLYNLARGMPAGARVVEIGSWKGKSTYCLAKGLKQGRVIAIDPFDATGEEGSEYGRVKGDGDLVQQFRRNLDRDGLLRKIDIKVGRSREFADQIEDMDFLFIDGDHSIEGCRYDFEAFAQHVKPGGLLAFHDYHPDRPELGPTWVVDNLVAPAIGWQPFARYDSLVVFRRAG